MIDPVDEVATAAQALRLLQKAMDRWQRECFVERPPEFFALELTGEAGELANLEKKAWRGRIVGPERFRDEAADVVIALMNYANSRGIDLASSVADKTKEIERRRLEGTH